ncbi:interferon-induced GTP-binding protein Mx1-like [Cavia porcellus]|uniref:interferon-induced GTP-binding protein Mx1-like n=1 Tax=Cavia porcellus TaxID=10141 RepID=UPI002FE1E075
METNHSPQEARKHRVAPAPSHRLLIEDANKGEKAPAMVAENNLCRQYEEKVRPCIDLIDSLRALGVEQDLALPAIAVIGDQSSGKSSVLEALSGVALPRGSGLVTRCPLELKLKKLRPEEEWRGSISYRGKEEAIPDASKVEDAIRQAQEEIAGPDEGIKDELISLLISSPDAPDLTLIDLPGITRVAIGAQPWDIGNQVKQLIMNYIEKEETINLVVIPSNVDIATTEALRMAQEVDPKGDRTIGILTKPDLVDKGAEDKVLDVVHNLSCPLKKGYMVVRCRGQQDIQECLSLAEALQKERSFFEDHEQFRGLLEDGKATIPRLAERLSTELIAHICKSLPMLENRIREQHQKTMEELRKYASDIPENEHEQTFFLIEKIKAFNQDISALVEGEESVGVEDPRLTACLRQKFEQWDSMIKDHFKKGYGGLQRDVQKFESHHRGRELPGFVNYRTFETIVKKLLQGLEDTAVALLHQVTDLVRNAFTAVSEKNFSEFLNLHSTAKDKIEDLHLAQEEAAEAAIRIHFQMEQVIYCQDQVYQGALQDVRQKAAAPQMHVTFRLPSKESATSEVSAASEILQHLKAYCKEVRDNLGRQIPLIIQYYTLHLFSLRLQNAMLQLLQDQEVYAWLLTEQTSARKKRKVLKERLERLGQARRQLARFPA